MVIASETDLLYTAMSVALATSHNKTKIHRPNNKSLLKIKAN